MGGATRTGELYDDVWEYAPSGGGESGGGGAWRKHEPGAFSGRSGHAAVTVPSGGAAGSGGRSCFASIALRSLMSCSREYKITSRNVASGISTLSAGNHRVNTASSASERALYPDRRCGSFSGVMGTEPTLVPGMKFGTKTCLQKGA